MLNVILSVHVRTFPLNPVLWCSSLVLQERKSALGTCVCGVTRRAARSTRQKRYRVTWQTKAIVNFSQSATPPWSLQTFTTSGNKEIFDKSLFICFIMWSVRPCLLWMKDTLSGGRKAFMLHRRQSDSHIVLCFCPQEQLPRPEGGRGCWNGRRRSARRQDPGVRWRNAGADAPFRWCDLKLVFL